MRIGIIEDDRLLCQALEIALREAGYGTASAHTKKEALSLFDGKEDLLLIDIGLPDGDGVRLYQQLCREGKALHGNPREDRIPAIFLTARDEERDMLAAFDVGAEDYVVKPFGIMELQARVKAVLRRTERRGDQVLTCGDLEIDPAAREVRKGGKLVDLTFKEFELLKLLCARRGVALTRDEILQTVWDYDYTGETRTVDMHVKALRQKLGDDVVTTVRGVGYKMS